MNAESLKGTMALPKSVVCSASRAESVKLSHAISGCVPPTVVVWSSWWFSGQLEAYSASGESPERPGDLLVESPPWAETEKATKVASAVSPDSQAMASSQSWRWPSPLVGESLGIYLYDDYR